MTVAATSGADLFGLIVSALVCALVCVYLVDGLLRGENL